MAAVLAEGKTTIYNAACEPYLQQLSSMLNRMGPALFGQETHHMAFNGKVDGTASDAFDIPSQVKMIKAFQPDLAKLGVIYTTTEPNSLSQLETLKSEAAKFGIEIVEKGINDATELPTVTANLLPEVQAVTNLTDNNVVENMSTLLEQANTAGIPVYGSEIEQVKKGCIAAASLDYVALGEKTAEMALGVRSENNAGSSRKESVTSTSISL